MSWRNYLTETEGQRLDELAISRKAASSEMKAIYDRCRKRMSRDNAKRAEA